MIFHDRIIGVITLYNKLDGRSFTVDDLRFLATIASAAAVSVENAAVYERSERLAAESRRRAQEFSILYLTACCGSSSPPPPWAAAAWDSTAQFSC
jgi:GAF domain-containing protein